MVTAIGGGIVRDLLIGAVPPATFSDWRYLVVATAGGRGHRGNRFFCDDLAERAADGCQARTGSTSRRDRL